MWTSTQPREIIAQAFLVISLLLGIPSVIVFVCSAWGSIELHVATSPKATPSSATGNLIVDGLVAGASLVGKAFSLANSTAEWLMRASAFVSLSLTVVAAVLFVIARGLHASRSWARILGILVALAPLMISVLTMASFRRPVPIALGAGGALLAGYAVWVLGWRFV
jgi:hypothetical protein